MVVKPVERTGVVDSGLSGPPVEIRGLGIDLREEGLRETRYPRQRRGYRRAIDPGYSSQA